MMDGDTELLLDSLDLESGKKKRKNRENERGGGVSEWEPGKKEKER